MIPPSIPLSSLLLPGNPPTSLSFRALTVGTTSFVLMCAFLPFKCPLVAEIDHPTCETRIYILTCATLEMSISEPFSPKNPKSSSVCHECYTIYMQTAYMNTLHMQIELVPWKFSVSSLPAARFGRPADTQSGHFIHHGTKPGFDPSLPENHRIQRLGRPVGWPSVLP